MKIKKLFITLLLTIAILFTGTPIAQASSYHTGVYINGVEQSNANVITIEHALELSTPGVDWQVTPGYYWLDSKYNFGMYDTDWCMNLLSGTKCSYTNSQYSRTGVYVNNQELTREKLSLYEQYFGSLQAGYYTLDSNGYLNPVTDPWITEGGDAYISGDGQGCVGFTWTDATYLPDDC